MNLIYKLVDKFMMNDFSKTISKIVNNNSKDELTVQGDLSTFSYFGGSGLSLHVNFCVKCSTKIYTQPDILQSMIYVPAGLLRDQIEFKPKVEIWAGSRPSWTRRPESLVESYADNGTIERISSLLENLDQRA